MSINGKTNVMIRPTVRIEHILEFHKHTFVPLHAGLGFIGCYVLCAKTLGERKHKGGSQRHNLGRHCLWAFDTFLLCLVQASVKNP